MPLEALLTFIGILIAAWAIARPVQRRSLGLFVPTWILPLACLTSLILIIIRDAPFGIPAPFGWPLEVVTYFLTLGAFMIPVLATIYCGLCWHRARLTNRNTAHVEQVFQAALREDEFDEVERILRKKKNQHPLEHLPASATSVLFHPAMVGKLVGSCSLIHLELLANMGFLSALDNRLGAVDTVVRVLLRADASPIRSAVGGQEYLRYSDSERSLMEKTFQNPVWFSTAGAYYALVVAATEVLQKGELDIAYNKVDQNYMATQGVSSRSRCPIYLAAKTEVLAIEAALENKFTGTFYVELWHYFRTIQERSKFDKAVWESSPGNWDTPTPYSYLLNEINLDHRNLSCKALIKATSKSLPLRAEQPGNIAHWLARSWSFCIWKIARSEGQVSPGLRDQIIREYLLFLLALNGKPSEIYAHSFEENFEENIEGLQLWRDLFLKELKERAWPLASIERASLESALESLDTGKHFVSEGYDWLEGKLLST